LEEKPVEGTVRTVICFEEIHIWRDSKDWLWDRMERLDRYGHVSMRCRQIRRVSYTEQKE